MRARSRGLSFELSGAGFGGGANKNSSEEARAEVLGGASFEFSGDEGFGEGAAIIEMLNGEVLGGMVQQGEKI